MALRGKNLVTPGNPTFWTPPGIGGAEKTGQLSAKGNMGPQSVAQKIPKKVPKNLLG